MESAAWTKVPRIGRVLQYGGVGAYGIRVLQRRGGVTKRVVPSCGLTLTGDEKVRFVAVYWSPNTRCQKTTGDSGA